MEQNTVNENIDYEKCIICQEKAHSKKRSASIQIEYVEKLKVNKTYFITSSLKIIKSDFIF